MSKSKKELAGSSTKNARVRKPSPLASCPVDGAGWCPYPFSAAQLRKRLQKLQKDQAGQSDQQDESKNLAASGRNR